MGVISKRTESAWLTEWDCKHQPVQMDKYGIRLTKNVFPPLAMRVIILTKVKENACSIAVVKIRHGARVSRNAFAKRDTTKVL